MNKYERHILDKRGLKTIEKRILYWNKYLTFPPENLQREFYSPKIYSKWKSERKEARKDFVRRVEGHSQEKARIKYADAVIDYGYLSIIILDQIKKFNFIDELRIFIMEFNPKSTVNSPSWNFMQLASSYGKGFKKGLEEATE